MESHTSFQMKELGSLSQIALQKVAAASIGK
jgi:hypothetical protein